MAVRTATVTKLGHVPVSVAIGSAAGGPALLRNTSRHPARAHAEARPHRGYAPVSCLRHPEQSP